MTLMMEAYQKYTRIKRRDWLVGFEPTTSASRMDLDEISSILAK
jgi:hypothetical protein